jgi:hypothetical protein
MLNCQKTNILYFLTKPDHEITSNVQVSLVNRKIATTQSLKYLGLTVDTSLTWKHHTGELTSRLNKACYAIRSIKPFMSLDVLRSAYCLYVHSTISYGIIFWGNSSDSEEIFKIQRRKIRIIMNSSKNVSCRQQFKELNIFPIQSSYIYIYIFPKPYFLLKLKTNFCLTHSI